jgi:hypothetical protein
VAGVRAVTIDDGALRLEYEGQDAEAAALLKALVQAGIAVVAFTPQESDLEALFLQLTRAGVAA